MLERLNHVAIAVPDIDAAAALYRGKLGANVTEPQALPEHGVTVVFIDVGNTKIELLEPLGEGSPIAAFLEKNPPAGCIISVTRLRTLLPLVIASRRKVRVSSGMASRRPAPTASRFCSCIPRISTAR